MTIFVFKVWNKISLLLPWLGSSLRLYKLEAWEKLPQTSSDHSDIPDNSYSKSLGMNLMLADLKLQSHACELILSCVVGQFELSFSASGLWMWSSIMENVWLIIMQK